MRLTRRSPSTSIFQSIPRYFLASLTSLLFACMAELALPATASPQNLFGDSGFSPSHGSYSSVPYEHVDPLSGNLIVVVNDLSLPGNAGLDLRVTRSYNSKFHRDFENGDQTLDERTPLGVGWRLHFGRVLHDDSNQPGGTRIETPDGGGQQLYQAAGGEGWMSKSYWRYDRATSTAYLPNGLVYVFGYIGETSGPRGRVRYVTEIRDPFNNVITFEYGGNGSLPGSIWRIRQYLGASQIREVLFNYNGNGSLATMTYDGRVWSYQYDPAPGWSGEWVLRRVVPPIGLPWEYVYGNVGVGPELTGLRPSGGGTMDYTYASIYRRASSLNQFSRVVATRATGGTRITPGTWTFTYSQGANQDTTIVDCPCGKMTFRYAGAGINGVFNAWKSGVLLERTVAEPGPSGAVLETEVLDYQPSAPISNDSVPGQSGVWSDAAVYRALLTSRVLTRGPQSWTTTYQYHTPFYNDFGRPWRIIAAGDQTRTTELIYDYNFASHWIVNGPMEERVSIGSQVRGRVFTYNAQGFLTRSNTYGVIVDHEPNAAGQVAKTKDAHNHETTFTYSWGVLANTTTPLLATSRAINPDGTVESETVGTVGGLTTRYIYDVGGRLRRVRPPSWPAVNETVYEYDDVTTYFIRTSRDTSQKEQRLDGFGRVMSTSDQTGVKTMVERDACGRVTFASAPYSGAAPTRGTTTVYDALGRTKTVTAPGTPTAVTTYTYTGADVSVLDAEGRTTKYFYDAFSGPSDARLMRVTDATNTNTDYQYDVLGGWTRVTGPGTGPVRERVYNARGELTSETQPESGTTTYGYDSAGLLTSVTNALNQVTTFTYDQNDRTTGRTVAGNPDSNVTTTYDVLGRVQQRTIPGVVTTFGYDAAGRQSSRTDGVHPSMSFTSSYSYDANDNLTTIVYPQGRQVTYQYDNEFRLIGVKNNGAVFANNYVYDSAGRLQSFYTGAVGHTTLYDDRDRVSQVAAGPGIGHLRLYYDYDKVSNVKTITDDRYGGPQTVQTYTYDVLNRIRTATGPWGPIEWTYDSAGNRQTETRGGTTVYHYDGANRLASTSGQSPESFGWTALGQMSTNTRGTNTTTYSYTPAGMLKTASGPGLSASYLYDGDQLRVKREVNGRTYVTVRSISGQVLSEFESCGGTPVWSRDNVYAGSRLLGAVRANVTLPTVTFDTAASNAGEAIGAASPGVRITTANGAALPCSVSVSFTTQPGGTATVGQDYAATTGTLTFPAGAASGTVLPISVPVNITNDPYYEPAETFVVALTGGSAVTVGTQSKHTLSIQDNDVPPTISLSGVTVNEAAGLAYFDLTLSERTGYQVQVAYSTQNQTAIGGQDFQHSVDTALIEPMQISRKIWVPIIDDAIAETASPPVHETFILQIAYPLHATLGTAQAIGTIVDNEPPRVPIDLTKQGVFFADTTALAGKDDYVVIGNHHDTSWMTVRLTFTRPDGSGLARDVALAPKGRYSFRVSDEPGLGPTDASLAVQSLTPNVPVMADHVVYEGPGWEAGRGTEGVPLSPVWYLPEGSVGYFEEWITVFNPSSEPINVWFSFMGASNNSTGTVLPIPTGPGRIKIKVRDYLLGDHATQIVGYKAGTEIQTPIAVERTMFWETDRRESHSSPGLPGADLSMNWYFAEGSTGFNTFVALGNPYSYDTPVTVQYLHENGATYSESITLPAFSRRTVQAPGWLPLGAFGYRITSTVVPIVAERSMYGGTNWTVGTAGVGFKAPATNWVFQEGATGSFWDTYILLANPSSTQASVWLALRPDSGSSIVWHNVLVPANSRRSVNVNLVPGMPGTVFRTEVISDYPVVAERVTFWPGVSGGSMSMQSGGDPMLLGTEGANAIGSANEAAIGSAINEGLRGNPRALPSSRINLSPYTSLRRALPVNLYQTLTPGIPAGPVERDLAEKALKNEAVGGDLFQATPFDASSLSSGGSWYGGHLTGGRRP
jgi:YD repeat-containing protein